MMSVTYEYDLVCIGSGPAGQRAAVQAAKLGKRVAVVERHLRAGGVSIETGTIPSKSFREAVCGFGYRRGDGRRLRPSMKQLLERVDDVVGREVDVVHDQLRRNDVELIHGHASFVGRRSRPGSNPTESPFSCPTTSSSWSSCRAAWSSSAPASSGSNTHRCSQRSAFRSPSSTSGPGRFNAANKLRYAQRDAPAAPLANLAG